MAGRSELETARKSRALLAIKVAHTVIWAVLVVCILAIPLAAWHRDFKATAILSAVIWIECLVLLINGWKCPLTNLAERYTSNREPDFDIFMPVWLARHNKTIFGALFLANEVISVCFWMADK